MIKQNVGTWDAYTRLTLGLMALGFGIGRSVRKRDLTSYMLMAAGAIKIAEGITRVCPMLYAMGISTTENRISKQDSVQASPTHDMRSGYVVNETESELS